MDAQFFYYFHVLLKFINSWFGQTLGTFWKLIFEIQVKSLTSRGQDSWCNPEGPQAPGKTMQTADCILIPKTHMKRSISKPQKKLHTCP